MGKRQKGQGSGKKSAVPAWSVWLAILLPFLAFCYLRARPVQTDGGDATSPELEAMEREREHLDMVRNALFSGKDSQYVFDEESKSWNWAPGQNGFASADYWEQTYKNSDRQYDWYGSWKSGVAGAPNSALKDAIAPSLHGGSAISVLNLGCGNSKLAEEMYEDGYWNITNVDISGAVIEKMRARNAHLSPQMSYLQMDISNMSFQSESFDLVIEKGTLDALYTGASHLIPLAVAEAWRVLRPGGRLASVTFGAARARRELLAPAAAPGWAARSTAALPKSPSSPTRTDPSPGDQHGSIYVHLLRKGVPGEEIPELIESGQRGRPRRKMTQ